jgi:hypothetical protein
VNDVEVEEFSGNSNELVVECSKTKGSISAALCLLEKPNAMGVEMRFNSA